MPRYAGVNAPGPGSLVDLQHPLGRGCIGCWWPNAAPDAGTGLWIPDLSGQGYHAQRTAPMGPMPAWAAGQLGGWALDFQGGAYNKNGHLAAGTVNLASTSATIIILGSIILTDENLILFYHDGSNGVFGAATTTTWVNFRNHRVYPDSSWHHYAFMASASANNSYWVDGALSDSWSYTAAIGGTGALTIGAYPALYWGLKGLMDACIMYDRLLPPEEVAWLYREPAAMIWVPGGTKTFLLGGAPAPLTVTQTATLYAAESYTATRGLGLSAAEREDLTRAMQLVGQEVEALARSLGLSAAEADSLTRAMTLRGLEALAATRTASLQAQEVTAALHAVQTYAQQVQDLSRAVALHAAESETVLRDLGAVGAEGLSVARALGLYATGGSDAEELLATWLVATFGAEQTSLTRGITLWAKEAAVGVRDVLRIADERGTLRLKDLRDGLRIDDERDTLRLE
ncbi:MAG: LamG-like jellyroll fold domain-containing protein [Armatimonadia bacterium]